MPFPAMSNLDFCQTIAVSFIRLEPPRVGIYWYFSRKYLELQLRTSARITLVTKLSCLVFCALISHRNASCLFHYITTIHFVIIHFQSLLFIYHVIFRSFAVLHVSLCVILLFFLITEVAPSKFSSGLCLHGAVIGWPPRDISRTM